MTSVGISVRPGDVLAGKYRVERVLGSGGMGYVVAARHLQLDQLVAMKFLRRGALDDNEASTRFLREAKASVRLRNEHVARVFDVGTLESGEPYIVMEHLDGADLSTIAKQRGALSPEEACEYVLQACEALAEAHSLGIVHRDIKLANLFVTHGPGGLPLVKVLDFGISKTNPFGESEHEMTRTTSMLGSPRFMSPEQMRDPRSVDARSDIWSLGVVLYRLVAGRPPFEAETLGRLLTMVMHEAPNPIAATRPDVPPAFEAVVARCLEKDPARRFANVAELAYALTTFALETTRARGAVERIAATLSVAPLPATSATSLAAARTSAPPGVNDTGGTASPWSGTQASRLPAARSPLAWFALGLVAALAGVLAIATLRRDPPKPAETTAAAPVEAPVAAAPTTATAPPPAPPAAEDPAPSAAAPAETATGSAATTATKPHDEKPKPRSAPASPSPPRRPPPASRPPRPDEIPATRD